MHIEEYDQLFSQGKKLLAQIRDGSLERLRRVGDLYQETLNDWEDLAKTEESVRREYEGRYLFELIQNADDVLVEWQEQQNQDAQVNGQRRIRIQLTPDSLIVANDGLPFSEDNIRALCRIHKTTKSASKQIGHKGIGFKSVLKISQTPQIFSGDFAFIFDRERFIDEVKVILGEKYLDQLLPILRAPFDKQLVDLSGSEQKIVQDIFNDGFVTVVRLPFNGEVKVSDIEEQIKSDIKPELLLFLNAIEEIDIQIRSEEQIVFSREVIDENHQFSEIGLLESKVNDKTTLVSRWLLISSEKLPVRDKSLVKNLGDAWQEINYLRCAIAFPLSLDGNALVLPDESQRFYVYFPTNEFSGLGFLINADLYLKNSREEIPLNDLNSYLIEQIVSLITTRVVAALKLKFPNSETIVETLAPNSDSPQRKFSKAFFENYMEKLNQTVFVPIDGQEYRPPKDICFMPDYVDNHGFRKFFKPSDFINDEPFWFPTVEVQTEEECRKKNGRPFLTHKLINVRILDFGFLGSVLNEEYLNSINDRGAFFRFLAEWWEQIPYYNKYDFVNILKKKYIIPTHSGWKNPEETIIFQANFREKEDFEAPIGFGFEVVPVDIYGEDLSSEGIVPNFLKKLGVRKYSSQSIIQSAILPKLIEKESFKELMEQHRHGVFLAYCLLFEYLDKELSTGEILNSLEKVPVPAYSLDNPETILWKSAKNVYFSKHWIENDDLEILLEGFQNVYFLSTEFFDIDLLKSKTDRKKWEEFYSKLGVTDHLRLQSQATYRNEYRQLLYSKEGYDKLFWKQYLMNFRNKFRCNNDHRRNTPTRELNRIHFVEHLDKIISQKILEKSKILIRHLSANWENYQKYLYSTLQCSIKKCQSKTKILSYMGYCLQEIPWISCDLSKDNDFLKAKDIWILSPNDPPEVHHLLPTLTKEFSMIMKESFIQDIFPVNRDLSDYINLLLEIPKMYPLAKCSSDQVEAVRRLHAWVCNMIQNHLLDLGKDNYPEIPDTLNVLASRNGQHKFIEINNKLLVVGDDPMLAKEWQDDLWFAQLDKNMSVIKDWFELRLISEVVKVRPIPGKFLADKTQLYMQRFHQLFPFLLAMVYSNHSSRYRGILGRLARLQVHCVNELQVLQKCDLCEEDYKRQNYPAFLNISNKAIEGTNIEKHHGDFYINPNDLEINWRLGEQIAKYIEIESSEDVFTVLWNLEDHDQRKSYIKLSKHTEEEIINQVRLDLEEVFQGKLDDDFPQMFSFLPEVDEKSDVHDEKPPSSSGDDVIRDTPIGQKPKGGLGPLYPRDITKQPGTSAPTKTTPPKRPMGRKLSYVAPASSGDFPEPLTPRDNSNQQKTDRHGILRVLAYEKSRDRRARELPHNNPGYDIESVGRDEKKRFIEVKSLSEKWGEANAPGLTSNEFEFARNKGQDYWLYVVECAQLDEYCKIHKIQDPVSKIDRYHFDYKWQEIAKPD